MCGEIGNTRVTLRTAQVLYNTGQLVHTINKVDTSLYTVRAATLYTLHMFGRLTLCEGFSTSGHVDGGWSQQHSSINALGVLVNSIKTLQLNTITMMNESLSELLRPFYKKQKH